MTDLIFPYSQATDRKLVGGKAQRLAALHQAGITVPPGFVISTIVSKEALKTSTLPSRGSTSSSPPFKPSSISPKQRKAFYNAQIFEALQPELQTYLSDVGADSYAVRSSAPVEDSELHPFAGLFDSYLHVPQREVLGAVKRCMLSAFNERAISYARQRGVILSFEMAVLVLPMVYGDFSGVVFTASPIEKQMMVIEVVTGLCDKLVLGQVSPLRYNLSRQSGDIQNQAGASFEFDASLIKSIYQVSMEIERLFAKPQDIEFVVENRRVIIVQSRDIPPTK
jgi:pyruvate,water dikinase